MKNVNNNQTTPKESRCFALASNDLLGGAVDMNGCFPFRNYGKCECEMCVCGNRKHTGIHAPFFGQPAGSKPYGHEFQPRKR